MKKGDLVMAAALLVLTVASFLLSLGLGPVAVQPGEVAAALLGGRCPESARIIIREVRLPRTLTALLGGVALSASGVIFQALLRNPLADPYLLGVSSGAALGAVLCMALGFSAYAGLVPAAALVGGGLAATAVYLLARKEGGLPPHSLILAGVTISSFCSALVLFLNVMMESRQLQGALFWVMGSLSSPVTGYLLPVSVAVGLGLAVGWAAGPRLNLLTQGDEVAAALGLEVERERKILFGAACVMTGGVVAVSGLIGFVGLVIPHAARMLFGPDHRRLIPASCLLGASCLILSDIAARMVLAPAELPVGVITALVGAPFFLHLLRKQRRSWSGV